MGDIKIGTHDRGIWDREDDLLVKGELIGKFKTAKEATDFARSCSGSEVIIKNKDNTYFVYKLKTSEEGKKFVNQDFKDDSVTLTSDVSKMFGGKSYVITDDNVIRTLEIEGIELDSIDQDFIIIDLNLILEDKDGIESNTKNDLEGTISGSILIKEELIKYALGKATLKCKADYGDVRLRLNTNPSSGEYKININYKDTLDLGKITLKMEQGGIRAKVETSGIVGNTFYYAGKAISIDVEQMATDIIKNYLTKNLGLKVTSSSKNEFKLELDFKNNKLLKQLPIADMNINLEEARTNPVKTYFNIDGSGDLNIKFSDAKAIASSNVKGSLISGTDPEGPDQLKVSTGAKLKNDFSSEVHTNVGLKVNITSSEKDELKSRVKGLTGKEIDVYGKLEITDVKVDAKFDSERNLENISYKGGKLKIDSLNVKLGNTSIELGTSSGDFGVQQKDKKIFIDSKNVNINGKIENNDCKIDFKNLNLQGRFVYDNDNPSKISLEGNKGSKFQISLDYFDKNTKNKIVINNFEFKDSSVDIDFLKDNFVIISGKGDSTVSISSLNIGKDVSLKNFTFKGDLFINPDSGKIVLHGKEVEFSGKLSNINLQNVKGSTKLVYDPNTGIKLENINFNTKGKVGNFDISKMKIKGDIVFDTFGNLVFLNTTNSDIVLDSSIGLKIKGDLKVKYDNNTYTFKTNGVKPISIKYEPKSGSKINVSDLTIQGSINFNPKKSTLTFNNKENVLKINGNVAGVNFNNINITGEAKYDPKQGIIFSNSKGRLNISGIIDDFNIKELSSTGEIKIDPTNKSMTWDKDMTIDLPDKKLKLSTTGSVFLKINENGEVCISTKNGVINATLGNSIFKDFKIDGRIIYNPNTGTVKIEGFDGKELKITGNLNDKPIDVSTTGFINFSEKNGKFEFSGENFKINGTVDGFKLESVTDSSGKVIISKDLKQVDVSQLKFNFRLDDINISDDDSSIKSAEDGGYELTFSGNINTEKNKLVKFLNKISKTSLTSEETNKILNEINTKIQTYLSRGELSNASFKNLSIKFDKDFNFQNFNVNVNSSLVDTNIQINVGKENKLINIGKIDLSMLASGNKDNLKIEKGKISFDFTDDLRNIIKEEVTKELEKAGLKGVNVEVSKDGKVKVKKATYEVFSTNKTVKSVQELNIPIISTLFGEILKIPNISLDLKLSTKIINNKLVVSVDDASINELFGSIISAVSQQDPKGEVSKKLEEKFNSLKSKKRLSNNVFSLDLKDIVHEYVSKDINLDKINISKTGKIDIDFSYKDNSNFYNDEPIPFHEYLDLKEQLHVDPVLEKSLTDDQKNLLKDKFKKLGIPQEELTHISGIIDGGKFTNTMLDRLENISNKDEAIRLIELYKSLSKTSLFQDKKQEIISVYPEKYLTSEEFSRLIKNLQSYEDIEFTAVEYNILKELNELIEKSKKVMISNFTKQDVLSQEEIKRQFIKFKEQGRNKDYEDLEQLASVSDSKTKAYMINELMRGWTKSRSERSIAIIIGNSTPDQQREILSYLDLERLGNEMENVDQAAEVLNVIRKAGFNKDVLNQYLGKFFDGVSSQFGMFNKKDDDVAAAFIRKLDKMTIQDLPDSIKWSFFKALDNGSTSSEEYQRMREIAQGCSPKMKAQLIKYLMDQSPTNSDQETLIKNIILDTPIISDKQKSHYSLALELLNNIDAKILADELEDDKEAAVVAVFMAKAYKNAGVSNISGKLHDFLCTLSYQHRNKAIDNFIGHPDMKANKRELFMSISPDTLKTMINYLMDGYTSGSEEQTILKILSNTSFEQYGKIMSGDPKFLEHLGDELDKEDIQKLDKWTVQYNEYIKKQDTK